MKLSDIMTRDVKVVRPDDSIRSAAEKMRDEDIGALPVCDGEKIVGMITDRDITVRVIARGEDPNRCKVSDAMTKDVVYCFEDDDTGLVAAKMGDKQVKRIVVIDRDKKLVGMVSLGDLAVKTGEREKKAEAVEKISQPAHGKSMAH